MQVARENPSDALVTTASGLAVPIRACQVDATTRPGNIAEAVDRSKRKATAYEPDGRRRAGILKAEWKAVQKAVDILNGQGIGVVLACKDRFDGKEPCRGFLSPEGDRFGCQCSKLTVLEV